MRQKPLMNMRQILLMNLGFFGIQYSFGMQQTAVNPIYNFLGANPDDLPILNLAGPITGLLIQPLIGALSDRTWSPRWGRRKPFFLVGAIGCSICLFLFPFVAAVWMAVLLLWLLDASNNTAMEPYRAFIADKLPPSQLAKGFLAQSFFTGFGITLANVSLFVFQTLIAGATDAGIPYWVVGSFILGSVCSIATVLVSVISTPEIPPSAEELAALRAKKGGLGAAMREIWEAIVEMPPRAAQARAGLPVPVVRAWSATGSTSSLSIAKSVFGATADDPGTRTRSRGPAWSTAGTTSSRSCVAFPLVAFASKRGAKMVHMRLPALRRGRAADLPAPDQQVPAVPPDHRPRHRLGVDHGRALHHGRADDPVDAVRRLHGHHQHDDRHPDAHPDGDLRGDLQARAGRQPEQRHQVRRRPARRARRRAMLWIKEPPIVRDVDDVLAMPMGGGH